MTRLRLGLVLAILFFLFVPSAAIADVFGEAEEDTLTVGAVETYTSSSEAAAASSAPVLTVEEMYALYPECAEGLDLETAVFGCPYWVDGVLYILQKANPGDDVPASEAITLTLTDFRSLPLTPSTIVHQPAGTWTLVNVETIVYTSSDTQTLSTTVLGLPITVRARPVSFRKSVV